MASEGGPHLLFVYGTLKRGQYNNHMMTSPEIGRSRWVGTARTEDKWPLIVATSFNLPFLLDARGHGEVIIGDVYRIDDIMLSVCDDFEWYPEVYDRSKISVRITETASGDDECPDARVGDVITTWVYMFKKFSPELLTRKSVADFNTSDYPYDPSELDNEDDCLRQIDQMRNQKSSTSTTTSS